MNKEHRWATRHAGFRLIGTVLVVVAIAAVSYIAGRGLSPEASTTSGSHPQPPATAPVERRVLNDDVEYSGTLQPEISMDVTLHAPTAEGADPIVTALTLQSGESVRVGGVLTEVAGRPVFAFQGGIPSYRDLHTGVAGADVVQLQRNLQTLGLTVNISGVFDGQTSQALREFYRRKHYAIPDTASTPATTASSGATGTSSAAQKATGLGGSSWPRTEFVYLPRLPATLARVNAVVGRILPDTFGTITAGAMQAVLTPLPESPVQLRLGQIANVILPDGTSLPGHITDLGGHLAAGATTPAGGLLGSGADQPNAGSGTAGTVKLGRTVASGLLGQTVTVRVRVATSRTPVWVVPYSAVRSEGSDAYSITVDAAGAMRRVNVHLGMTAAGLVAIKPLDGQVHAGDLVLVSA